MSKTIVPDEEIPFAERPKAVAETTVSTGSSPIMTTNVFTEYILGVLATDRTYSLDQYRPFLPYISLDESLKFPGPMNIPKSAYLDILRTESPNLVELLECTDIGDLLKDSVDVETVYNQKFKDLHVLEDGFGSIIQKKMTIQMLLRNSIIIPSYHFLGYCMKHKESFHAYYAHLVQKGKIMEQKDTPLIKITIDASMRNPFVGFYETENILSFVNEKGERKMREMLLELSALEKGVREKVNSIVIAPSVHDISSQKEELRIYVHSLLKKHGGSSTK